MIRTALVIIVGTVIHSAVVARPLASAVSTQPSAGHASLSGRVERDGDGHVPIRGATVTLASLNGDPERLTSTDQAGRFFFDRLPAGAYTVSASSSGYLPGRFGARRAGLTGIAVRLNASDQVHTIVIPMTRGGVLSGRLLDISGGPAVSIGIRALRLMTVNGERRGQFVGEYATPRTDETGAFRVYGLPPGDYLVVANAQRSVGGGFRAVNERQFDLARSSFLSGRGLDSTTPDTDVESVGYAAVYYPGTTSPSEASIVRLGKAQEKDNLDFRLELTRTSTITGRVVGADGIPAGNLRVNLQPRTHSDLPTTATSLGTALTTADAAGSFRFSGVPPDEYRLMVQAPRAAVLQRPNDSAPATSRQTGSSWAEAAVRVDGADREVTLVLHDGMKVSGRVRFDKEIARSPLDFAQMRASLVAVGPGPTAAARVISVATDGSFLFDAVTPGDYQIRLAWPSGDGAPQWVMSTVQVEGRESADSYFTVQPGVDVGGVDVALSDRVTELSGRLLGTDGTPVSDYFLIVFSAEQAFWKPGSRRQLAPVRLSAGGMFVIRGLPPGTYNIGVVSEFDPAESMEPAFLAQLAEVSHRVTLTEGEHKIQDLMFSGGGSTPGTLNVGGLHGR